MKLYRNGPDVVLPKLKISPRLIAILVAALSLYALYWVNTTKVQEIESKSNL